MSIQWFPGHMHSTRKAIGERIKTGIDVVIELLDARLPGSSANPMLAAMTAGKPSLKLLNKQDLADPAVTARWLDHYNAQTDTRALAFDATETAPAQRLQTACRELAPNRGGMAKPLRVLICGIPNVGKSTLINALLGKRAAKTGDEAGITRQEQRLTLAKDFYLFDTPGVLWPKIAIPESGNRLAATGAIGRNAYDEEVVVLPLLDYLRDHYPEALVARYRIEDPRELDDDELLVAIARKRGAVMSGGRIHRQKASELVLTDLRSGILGRISLETPEEFTAWRLTAEQADAAREAERERLKALRRPQRGLPENAS